MEEKILKLLGRKNYLPSNIPQLLERLKLPPREQQNLQCALRDLERDGRIARIKGNRYILPREADLVPGRIQITRQGRGFLLPDDPGQAEIAVPESATGTAMHDDHVLVRLDVRPQGRRPKKSDAPATGTVVRVLERRRNQLVGTFHKGPRFLYVVPDDPRINHDIYVPKPRDVGRPARVGDKVVVELTGWESRHLNPEGIVTEVLGPPTAEGVDMLGVIRNYDLSLKFPRKVLQEARRFGSSISEADCAGRIDCREHAVVTIDPADARDFDDAFFLEPARGNRWKLWVHIADVSHYVKPGSALDREARERGNSTYLVDRVVPMLPEALSNELCSLKPEVDRLTKCVEFLLSSDGKVIRSRFHEAVIHSQRRFSYEEAMEVLEGKGNGSHEKMLREAGTLAQKIRRHRFANGSLDLDFPETKIRLDSKGRVDRIEKVENDESHQLIEEFMLLANEAVATKLLRSRRATIHRVHERPDPKRLREYREEILGHNLPCGNLEKTAEVQKLLKRLGNLAIGAALKIGFLKSLARARYAVDSLGHYGLAKDNYTHFTSPIRRYADLVVHRSLFGKGKLPEGELRKIAEHVSTTERNSADAERDSKDVKLYAYLRSQLKSNAPHEYVALVTDIRNFGLFIDVPDLGMRGLVPLSVIEDDFYEFDPARVEVKGRRSGRIIRLGDQIPVVVDKVDPEKKEVDFRMVRKGAGGKRRTGRGSSGKEGKSGRRKRSRNASTRRGDRRPGGEKGGHRSGSPGKGGAGASSKRRGRAKASSGDSTGKPPEKKAPAKKTSKKAPKKRTSGGHSRRGGSRRSRG